MAHKQQTTLAQTNTLEFEEEMKSTRKLLERVPLDDAHREYKPHEKSMPLNRLASHVAELPSWQKMALDTEVFDLPQGFKPVVAGSSAEQLEKYDKKNTNTRSALAAATDEALTK